MSQIPLNEVAFMEDLHVLLGVSEQYVRLLVSNPKSAKHQWYRDAGFPQPFYKSPSGIRVWFVSDVERWCRSIRMKATSLRMKRCGAFLDRPEIAERILGL